jgi:hypothetical protein
MAITRPLINILVLIIYIGIFVPLILPHLLNMFIDFISNSDMFNIQYCSTRVLQSENGNYTQIVECTQEDLRPFVIFIFQMVVYFIIPLVIVFRVFRR